MAKNRTMQQKNLKASRCRSAEIRETSAIRTIDSAFSKEKPKTSGSLYPMTFEERWNIMILHNKNANNRCISAVR